MKEFEEFLQSIFLEKNEAEIYVALLKSKPSTILEIARMTKIHRSNVYDSISTLMDKGLVVESETQNKKMFFAKSPYSILNYLKEKETEFSSLIEKISFDSNKSGESRVFISKGRLALKNAINSLTENSQAIYVYGVPFQATELIGPMIDDFHRRRIKNKIVMKHIYNVDSIERAKYVNSMKYTEARILPTKHSPSTTVNVTDEKVILIVWNKDITIIEIDDKDVADSYKSYFEILWLKSKKLS
jgi:sugar-specific transcriptional regulator TrmB